MCTALELVGTEGAVTVVLPALATDVFLDGFLINLHIVAPCANDGEISTFVSLTSARTGIGRAGILNKLAWFEGKQRSKRD